VPLNEAIRNSPPPSEVASTVADPDPNEPDQVMRKDSARAVGERVVKKQMADSATKRSTHLDDFMERFMACPLSETDQRRTLRSL
jgi:hypothetical protein